MGKPEWTRERIIRNRAIVRMIKKRRPCFDCGKNYPHYVMEFDHVRGSKVASVSRIAGMSSSLKMLLEEIAKCELVCANCHRIRTHKRGYTWTRSTRWKRQRHR